MDGFLDIQIQKSGKIYTIYQLYTQKYLQKYNHKKILHRMVYSTLSFV